MGGGGGDQDLHIYIPLVSYIQDISICKVTLYVKFKLDLFVQNFKVSVSFVPILNFK